MADFKTSQKKAASTRNKVSTPVFCEVTNGKFLVWEENKINQILKN